MSRKGIVVIDLKVDNGVLQVLAESLRRSALEIDQVAGVYQQDVEVLRGRWTGNAADSATRSHQRWIADVDRQVEYLEQLAKTIDQIDDIYQQAERDAASFWPF